MPWKIIDVAIATALVFVGFLVALGLFGLAIDVVGTEEGTVLTPWLGTILEGLLVVAVWAFGVRKYGARWQTLGLGPPKARWSFALPWLALIGSLGFAGVYVAVVTALGMDSFLPPPIPQDVLGHGISKLLSTLVIVLGAPFAEEVFFRGFLLAALVPPLGPMRAAVVSAATFAAAHILLSTMLPIFVTGLLLSWLYLRTRSIWPPIMAHAAQNLIAVSIAW